MMISNQSERGGNRILKFNKKGKFGANTLNVVVLAIVVVVVLLTAYSEIIPEAQTAGDNMNDSARCEDAGCSYNATGRVSGTSCYNSTIYNSTTGVTCEGTYKPIPLSGLFSATGVVFVIVMAALLILVVKGFMQQK